MRKIDINITRYKLLLHDIAGKREALSATRATYEEQIERLVAFTVHEDGTVDRAVLMMLDIDTRVDESKKQDHYLELIQRRTQQELESLQITKLIEDTQAQLSILRIGAAIDEPETVYAEILRLEEIIAVASNLAARSIHAA